MSRANVGFKLTENRNLWRALCGATLVLVSVVFFFRLGESAFLDYDEATYAEVIRESEVSGDILTLKFLSKNWFEKPPFYIWAAIGSSRIFDDVEFAYRFPAAMSGVLTVLIVMMTMHVLTRSYIAAFAGGLVMFTMPAVFEYGRQVRFDVPVTVAMLFALYSFLKGMTEPRWHIGVAVGVAVGIMLKSVVGLIIIFPFFIWSFIYRDIGWLRSKFLWLGVLIGLLIVLPWHIYEVLRFGPVFWDDYFGKHILQRFEANILGGNMGAADYFKQAMLLSLPWSLMVLGSISVFIRQSDRTIRWKQNLLFLVVPVFVILAIFSVARTKLLPYIVPIFPFVSLYVTYLLYGFYSTESRPLVRARYAALFTVLVLGGIGNMVYHHYANFSAARVFAEEERSVGLIIASHPLDEKVYAYGYNFWETIQYYSGGRAVIPAQQGLNTKTPFLLIAAPLTNINGSAADIERLKVLFLGEKVVLYRFTP